MKKKTFPTFWVIVLIVAALWLFQELGYFTLTVSWFPIILVLVAVGGIVDNYVRR